MSRAGLPDPYTDPISRFSCITNGNIGIDPWLPARDRPVSTTAPPLRALAIADASVAGLPTVSNTKSAPRPDVSDRTAAGTSAAPSIVSVAPNVFAIASGAGRRSIAMIRALPAIAAPWTTFSPTPPAPMTATPQPAETLAALLTAPDPAGPT